MPRDITRRTLLHAITGASIGATGVTSATTTAETPSAMALTQDTGTYRRIGKDLQRLDNVWRVEPGDKLHNWANRLRNQSLNVLKPGLSDFLPDSVSATQTLIDQMVTTQGVMHGAQVERARSNMRQRWTTSIDGNSDTVQEQYYTELGYEVDEDFVTTQPYYALFEVLKKDLGDIVYDTGGDEQTLRDHANTVHNVLNQQIFAEFIDRDGGEKTYDTYNDVQTALIKNLETFDDVVQTIPKVVESAPGQSDQNRQDDQNQNTRGDTIVNAAANGATARVHQDTWKGKASNIIDQDPETQWQVAGNPSNILAFFSLPQRAQVTGDYIRIGTGGNRDVTRYEVYARDADVGDWQRKRVVTGSVTSDGTPDASHTFSSTVSGTDFALTITDHQAPELCYSSCDVPIREYHLKGRYIG